MQTVTEGMSSLPRITVSLALLRSQCHCTLLSSLQAFFLKPSSSRANTRVSIFFLVFPVSPAACVAALGLHYPAIYFLSAFCQSLTLRSNLFSPCHPKAETSCDLSLCCPCLTHIIYWAKSMKRNTLYHLAHEKKSIL